MVLLQVVRHLQQGAQDKRELLFPHQLPTIQWEELTRIPPGYHLLKHQCCQIWVLLMAEVFLIKEVTVEARMKQRNLLKKVPLISQIS